MNTKAPFTILKLSTLAIVIAWQVSVYPAHAYTVTLEQVGPNVLAIGGGAIDLTGLTFTAAPGVSASMIPNVALLLTGPTVSAASLYSGVSSGPANFGSGGLTSASIGAGDIVGILGAAHQLYVPLGYVSGTILSDNSTYGGATFSSLGVTPGTYEWTWGTGPNQNFTLQIGPAAVPDTGSTLGLLSVGLAALGGISRLRCIRLA